MFRMVLGNHLDHSLGSFSFDYSERALASEGIKDKFGGQPQAPIHLAVPRAGSGASLLWALLFSESWEKSWESA